MFRDNTTDSWDDPVAQRWNTSSLEIGNITMDRNFALLLVSLISAMLWVVYITYYNSRVLGFILTRLINKFYFQDENFKIGESLFFTIILNLVPLCKCLIKFLYILSSLLILVSLLQIYNSNPLNICILIIC